MQNEAHNVNNVSQRRRLRSSIDMNVLGKVSLQIIGSPTVPSDEHRTCQCNTSLGLTANQHGRCHGSHSAWRVIQVQHVSRHLVKLVHCILKHEGHNHIGDLGGQRRREETERRRKKERVKQPISQTYAQYSSVPFFLVLCSAS